MRRDLFAVLSFATGFLLCVQTAAEAQTVQPAERQSGQHVQTDRQGAQRTDEERAAVGLGDVSAEELIGQELYTDDRESAVGDIYDVVLDELGNVVAVVVKIGGFMGLGEKLFAVDVKDLQVAEDQVGHQRIVVAVSREQLETMPAFVATSQTRLYSHLREQSAEASNGDEAEEPATAAPDSDPSFPDMPFEDDQTAAVPAEDDAGQEYLATRAFSGPYAIPPDNISAYGIVAFPTLPTTADESRYLWVCEAFMSALLSEGEVRRTRPQAQQMVTFWPMNSDHGANELNQASAPSCERAVGEYHLGSAQQAISLAELQGERFGTRRGPFLLAWAPPMMKGQPDALIVVMDLSSRRSPETLKEALQRWRVKIERNPRLWENGWSVEEVRSQVQEFADYYGTLILKLLPGS